MPATKYRVAPAQALMPPRANRGAAESISQQSQKHDVAAPSENYDDDPTTHEQSRGGQTGSRIYFSPVDINRSNIELSEPLLASSSLSGNSKNDRYHHSDGKAMEDRFHIESLTQSPLLQRHVRRQWWEDDESDATPSLVDDTTESLPSTAPTTSSIASCKAIAIVDSTVNGAPVRYISQDCRLPIGSCSFLNISYGSSVQAELKTEQDRVVLRIASQVVQRKTGQKACLLFVEVEMTESVRRAVVEESSHTSNAKSFSELTVGTCGPETRALLSEVAKLKAYYQDFMVVRRTAERISIPWVSQHYYRCEAGSRQLREDIIELVAQHETTFTIHIDSLTIYCVPLFGTASQTWICFIQRELY